MSTCFLGIDAHRLMASSSSVRGAYAQAHRPTASPKPPLLVAKAPNPHGVPRLGPHLRPEVLAQRGVVRAHCRGRALERARERVAAAGDTAAGDDLLRRRHVGCIVAAAGFTVIDLREPLAVELSARPM